MLFEGAENLIVLVVGSIIGSFYSFIHKSFQGPYLNIPLISAQPIKGGIFRGFVRGLDKVLNTIIH